MLANRQDIEMHRTSVQIEKETMMSEKVNYEDMTKEEIEQHVLDAHGENLNTSSMTKDQMIAEAVVLDEAAEAGSDAETDPDDASEESSDEGGENGEEEDDTEGEESEAEPETEDEGDTDKPEDEPGDDSASGPSDADPKGRSLGG